VCFIVGASDIAQEFVVVLPEGVATEPLHFGKRDREWWLVYVALFGGFAITK
jgi:hypothetical protein